MSGRERAANAAALWTRSTNAERHGLLYRAGLSTLGINRPFAKFGAMAQVRLIEAMAASSLL